MSRFPFMTDLLTVDVDKVYSYHDVPRLFSATDGISFRVGVELRDRTCGKSVTIYLKPICCAGCRGEMPLTDILTPTGYQKMAAFALAKESFVPQRSKTRLSFVRLGDESLPLEAR